MIAKRILVLSRSTSLVRQVQVAAGPGCAVKHHDRASDVEEVLLDVGPFDVLVAGPMVDSRAGLERLGRLRDKFPGLSIVLALSVPVRSPLPDVVRVGAVDLVELPADRRRFRTAMRRALSSEGGVIVPLVAEGSVDHADDGRRLAEVYTVASPSGGCGKTFYSTNLALYLHRATNQRVCLVDLDLQFGEVSAALHLKPRYTMADVVSRSDDDDAADLPDFIEEYLMTHSSGYWVLPAPRSPAEADRISPPDITKIVAALRHHFDYLVLDTSAQLSEVVLTAMDQSTRLICMATLDLPSVRNMRIFLDTLEKLKIPTEAISVILNKVEPDIGIRVDEANEVLYSKIISVLPYAREVSRSINDGQPVLASMPKADISVKLAAGMVAQFGLDGAGAPPVAVGPAAHDGSGPAGNASGPDEGRRGGARGWGRRHLQARRSVG